MSARQERRKLINSLTNSSKGINSGGSKGSQQFSHFLELTKRHISLSSNSFHGDFNGPDQTVRQMSVVSVRDRDNLVTLLKSENNAQETEIRGLRKQIQRLNINASSNNEVSDQYSTPYVKICEEVDVFAARFYIRPEEYEKIEYEKTWLSLFDASIKLYKTKDFEFQDPKKVLNLKEIKLVRYLGNIMFFEFQPMIEDYEYLFIKFRDYEHLKKWDFALYINKIIEASLTKDKLFMEEINVHQLSVITKKAGNPNQSNLYQRRKVSYNDNLIKNEISEHPENSKISKSSSVKNVLHERQKEVLNEQKEDSDKNSTITKRFKKEKDNTLEIFQQIEEKKKKLENNKEKQIEKVNWKYDDDDPYKTPNNKIDYNNSFGPTDNYEFKIKPIEAKEPVQQEAKQKGVNNLDVSTLTNSAETRKKILSNLKQHKYFIKCAKDGIKERPKEVYLSPNEVELCWKDLQTNRVRKINIDDIKDISKNEKGQGLRKHAKKINPENCLVIRTHDKQVIELYSESPQMIADFADNLEIIAFKEQTTHPQE